MRIVISGTVGVGKSTVASILKTKLEAKNIRTHLLKEDTAESIYLQYYYDEPANWAFIAQLDFLFERFKNWLKDEKYRNTHPNEELITIYDRHFIDDYIFAELHSIKENISNLNSLTYQAVYKEILEKMKMFKAEPEFFFLLKAPLETILQRFHERNREEEREVDLTYWKELYHNYYERPMFKNHFLRNNKQVVVIETNDKTPDEIAEEIIKILEDYKTKNNKTK